LTKFDPLFRVEIFEDPRPVSGLEIFLIIFFQFKKIIDFFKYFRLDFLTEIFLLTIIKYFLIFLQFKKNPNNICQNKNVKGAFTFLHGKNPIPSSNSGETYTH